MPRLLAIEWDNSEARVVVANTRGSGLELQQTLGIDLADARTRSAQELGKHIAAALTRANITGGETLVAVGRASIELRFLNVPPVPAEELPDLVRFQASRQFSQSHEGGQLDYVPLASSGQPPTTVLAAAISGDALRHIQEICTAAGLVPKHLALRPFAVAPLITQAVPKDACVLVIDLLAEEADLTVVVDHQAVFPRTVRMGAHLPAEESAAALLMEARRTIAAAQNQLSGHSVTQIILFGDRSEFRVHCDLLQRDLKMDVKFVDPFAAVTLAADFQGERTQRTGRFAPLIGMMLHELRGEQQEIDFLAPRRPPVPQDYSRTYALAGLSAACLVLAMVVLVWWQLSELDSEIDRIQQAAKQVEKTLKSSKGTLEHVKLLDEFSAGEVAWISEFQALAEKMPPAEKMQLRNLKGNATTAGGRMVIVGTAQGSEEIAQLEAKLRDDQHRVVRDDSRQVEGEKSYPWHFQETVTISSADNPSPAGKKP
jgi:Tfp pilus assembly PilM family ATPase